MADRNCPICRGAGRIPWPEAGMLQDCDCVRAERAAPAAAPVEALPDGWTWDYIDTHKHVARHPETMALVWITPGSTVAAFFGPQLHFSDEEKERVKRAVVARNTRAGFAHSLGFALRDRVRHRDWWEGEVIGIDHTRRALQVKRSDGTSVWYDMSYFTRV